MGYAKLNFATSVTTGQALYDIVRVISGNITVVANLSYANTTNSEIVNTLAENWTIEYGSVADTTGSYIVSSPCVTNTKKHWILLQASNAYTYNSSAAFSTAGSGINLSTISDAVSISSYSNPTYYSTTGSTIGAGRYLVHVDASNTNIYVHWSSHHVLIYGKFITGAATGIMASLEYPETSLTQFTNTAPVAQYTMLYGYTTSFITTTTPSTGTTAAIVLQGINVHQPSVNTTSGVYNLGVSGFGTVTLSTFNPVFTIGTDGSNIYPLVPVYWSVPSVGIPIINLSQLTGVYRMATSATFSEGVFTVDSNSYVWLPISTTITGGTQSSAIGLLKK